VSHSVCEVGTYQICLVSLVRSKLAQAVSFLNVRSGTAWASLLFARLLTLIVI